MGFSSLQGREEENDRPEYGLNGQKCGDRKWIYGDRDKEGLKWEIYAKED